ncbi:putative membrane protein [Candidatus Sulfobium mesophilum]|uniref:Putative membrane protein n=1 Tax=Candidatus Sulfobium mesophilum TaxID=2016548 RepID=A0A2U3QG64_9BACT|nr:putative membrane protein [Candidatus Sulfobium mesophilum]
MQLQDKYRIAVLSAYALALHGIENLVPTPIPWLRLGLANIVTLVALVLFGFRTAIMVTMIRVILASLFTGTFLGPSFVMSFGGGLTSAAAMGLAYRVSRDLFGPIGLSLIGAFFHNAAQLALAYFLFIQRIEAMYVISPVIILLGTITGVANGAVSGLLIKKLLKKEDDRIQNDSAEKRYML